MGIVSLFADVRYYDSEGACRAIPEHLNSCGGVGLVHTLQFCPEMANLTNKQLVSKRLRDIHLFTRVSLAVLSYKPVLSYTHSG